MVMGNIYKESSNYNKPGLFPSREPVVQPSPVHYGFFLSLPVADLGRCPGLVVSPEHIHSERRKVVATFQKLPTNRDTKLNKHRAHLNAFWGSQAKAGPLNVLLLGTRVF